MGRSEALSPTLDNPNNYNPWDSDLYGSSGVGYENEDLIVWMRVAGLPTFRKLYRRFAGSDLPRGEHTMRVEYNYPVTQFDGTKAFVFSTTEWIGGSNDFLGIAYLVMGSLCVASSFAFLWFQRESGRSLGDLRAMHWD